MNKEIITLTDFAKIISNPFFIGLFGIDNVSYFEFKPCRFLENRYEIRLCDMTNEDHNKWENEVRMFTYEELKNFKL